MTKNEFKIIWHFKGEILPEDKDSISIEIRKFHKKSLIVFSDDLEITVIQNNNENT